jgi:hypothetical protein
MAAAHDATTCLHKRQSGVKLREEERLWRRDAGSRPPESISTLVGIQSSVGATNAPEGFKPTVEITV